MWFLDFLQRYIKSYMCIWHEQRSKIFRVQSRLIGRRRGEKRGSRGGWRRMCLPYNIFSHRSVNSEYINTCLAHLQVFFAALSEHGGPPPWLQTQQYLGLSKVSVRGPCPYHGAPQNFLPSSDMKVLLWGSPSPLHLVERQDAPVPTPDALRSPAWEGRDGKNPFAGIVWILDGPSVKRLVPTIWWCSRRWCLR